MGSERETIKDVAWLIYNKKTEPEINSEYYLNEGDIMKLGNVVFKIKMIQINNLGNSKNENNNNEYSNDTLMFMGNENRSIIINEQNNYDNIEALKTQKILVYANNKEKSEEKVNDIIKEEKIQNKICRICYQEEDDSLLNPLIKPCKCTGSVKYIHIKCLLEWLKSRTVHSPNNSVENNNFLNSYCINELIQCELCKENFPDYIIHNNIKYCLIDFDYSQENQIKKNSNIISAPNFVNTNNENDNNKINIQIENESNDQNSPNFIILDTIYPLNDGNKYRCIAKFTKDNKILIGRGLENQIILNEITVSRTHCLITAQMNKFGKREIKLQDDGSKFGTLLLLQSNKYEIIKGRSFQIQIGNIHLVMNIPIKKSFLSCCNVDVVDGKNSYERINSRGIKMKYTFNVLTEKSEDDIDKDKDNNNESLNNINIKSTEINNIKQKNNIDLNSNTYELKENIDINTKEIISEDKKDENILHDNNKEDILKEKKDINKNKDEKAIKDDIDKDYDKKSFINSIKRKNLIENINKGIKYIQTLPDASKSLSKNLLDNKSIKILKNIHINKDKSKKDSESVVIVEDESEKK